MTKTEQIKAKVKEAKDIRAAAKKEGRELTAEEAQKVQEIAAEVTALKAEAEAEENRQRADAELDQAEEWLGRSAGRASQATASAAATERVAQRASGERAYAIPRQYGSIRNFIGTCPVSGRSAPERAYRFGMYVMAVAGSQRASRFCQENGIRMAVDHNESENAVGAFLVPEEFDSDMISLLEIYGVFRRFARISPMTSDTKTRMRRKTGLTAYFVGEQVAGTKSNKTWDRVALVAKKIMCLALMSTELNEDAIISVGDDLMGEIAYAFAQKEDDCGFNGDGTTGATTDYGGIVGVRNALTNLSSTIANIAGLYVGAGNAYSELILKDFQNVVALLPTFGDTPNARWFMHKAFWGSVVLPLIQALSGGNSITNMQEKPGAMLLGYPVEFTQVMPKVEGNSQVCALLGDLRLAADFGDRRQRTIEFSREATIGSINTFETDQIAIKGTERFDINVHDVGNASATAASRVPGPIVGLITAAS